jgi:5'-deoxynucleotidase
MMKSKFMGWIFRMPLITRWPLMHCTKPEDVAGHSQQVAVVAHMLAVIARDLFDKPINAGDVAIAALYHECAEATLGDLSHPVKYSSPALTAEFKKLEDMAERECVANLPDSLQDHFSSFIVERNLDPEVKRLVKAADIICAFIKAKDEVRHGNPEFEGALKKLEVRLDAVSGPDAIEVQHFLRCFLDGCLANLDDLNAPN